MRRLTGSIVGATLILAMTSQTALADHATASAYVSVWHRSTLVATYSTTAVGCTSSPCSVYVTVPSKRDFGRATRWGCAWYPTTIYTGNTASVGQYCYNPQQFDWNFVFVGTINATHASDVTVNIYLVSGP